MKVTYKEFIDEIVSKRGNHSNYNKKIKGFEIHHILPRCLGGKNNSNNLVALTVGEHLMAHTLLFRENLNNKKLLTALYHMSNEIDIQELLNVVDNREEFMILVEDICKAKELYDISGKNNPMYHKHHTEKARKIMSEKKKGMYEGENNPRWGKHHTEEIKQKLSISRMGEGNPRARKVYCVELDMVFNTILDAQNYVGITSGILQCCSPKYNRETAGRHPITNERLHWAYVDENV